MEWLHEIKLDGYRTHARIDGGRGQVLTRRGNDWTAKYSTIVKASSDYLSVGLAPMGATAKARAREMRASISTSVPAGA